MMVIRSSHITHLAPNMRTTFVRSFLIIYCYLCVACSGYCWFIRQCKNKKQNKTKRKRKISNNTDDIDLTQIHLIVFMYILNRHVVYIAMRNESQNQCESGDVQWISLLIRNDDDKKKKNCTCVRTRTFVSNIFACIINASNQINHNKIIRNEANNAFAMSYKGKIDPHSLRRHIVVMTS